MIHEAHTHIHTPEIITSRMFKQQQQQQKHI